MFEKLKAPFLPDKWLTNLFRVCRNLRRESWQLFFRRPSNSANRFAFVSSFVVRTWVGQAITHVLRPPGDPRWSVSLPNRHRKRLPGGTTPRRCWGGSVTRRLPISMAWSEFPFPPCNFRGHPQKSFRGGFAFASSDFSRALVHCLVPRIVYD